MAILGLILLIGLPRSPPPVGKNSQIIQYFFLIGPLIWNVKVHFCAARRDLSKQVCWQVDKLDLFDSRYQEVPPLLTLYNGLRKKSRAHNSIKLLIIKKIFTPNPILCMIALVSWYTKWFWPRNVQGDHETLWLTFNDNKEMTAKWK